MLTVTPASFEKHLVYLKDNYEVIPLYDLAQRIKQKKLTGREAAITFDDGYRDNLTYALPLLEKYGLPATIFVTSSFIGKRGEFDWDMEYHEQERAYYINENEISLLSKHPLIEIGGHTHTHPRLSRTSYQDQEYEIRINKDILEKTINKKIRLFAYPFGGTHDFNKNALGNLSKLGFEFAFSNTSMLATELDTAFSIPRINIRECSVDELGKLLN
jgi:peptidoglycan/xylan/chitin deacetylase (PgdA/CDA1 family)